MTNDRSFQQIERLSHILDDLAAAARKRAEVTRPDITPEAIASFNMHAALLEIVARELRTLILTSSEDANGVADRTLQVLRDHVDNLAPSTDWARALAQLNADLQRIAEPPAPPAPDAALEVASPEALLASVASAASVSGVRCPVCGYINRPGLLICDHCGSSLVKGQRSTVGTRSLEDQQMREDLRVDEQPNPIVDTYVPQRAASAPPIEEKPPIANADGSILFEESMILCLAIEGVPTPVLIQPKAEIVIGRRDPATGTRPDIDLTTYAGYRQGVSRRHAVIRWRDRRLEISDLGSSNGTALNNARLSPHQSYVLRDGDQLMLGTMAVRILFQGGEPKG